MEKTSRDFKIFCKCIYMCARYIFAQHSDENDAFFKQNISKASRDGK